MAVDVQPFLIWIFADNEAQNNDSANPQDLNWDQSTDNNSRFQDAFQHLNNVLSNMFTTQRIPKPISTLAQDVATLRPPGNILKILDFFV